MSQKKPPSSNEPEHKKSLALRSKTAIAKNNMLSALEKTLGIVTTACRNAGIGRTQFYEWLETDPDFAAKVAGIKEIALDFAESQLMGRMKSNDTTAMIFYLKTQGKRRGYIERSDIDITTGGKPLKQNVIRLADGTEISI